jgi:DhnA family fructose-bisphosphate aldolase class Ia
MNSGKTIRLNRILAADGRTVIAALDHGIAGVTPLAALARPSQILSQVISGGADAILTTPGIARECAQELGKIGLIVRADSGATALTARWHEMGHMLPVEDALALGADGIAAMGIVGTDGEGQSLRGLGRLAAECERHGLVLLAEMLPGGFDAPQVSVEDIAAAARIGADLGADLIKIRYGGTPETFRAVTECCYRPIVILGGSKQSPPQLLDQVRGALAAGAVGVAVGRNIWQSPDPAAITRELAHAVHG